jgi:Flp pilus assembly pilin Flp
VAIIGALIALGGSLEWLFNAVSGYIDDAAS